MHQSLTVQIFKGENIESKKYLRRTLCKIRPSQVTMAELLKIEILCISKSSTLLYIVDIE